MTSTSKSLEGKQWIQNEEFNFFLQYFNFASKNVQPFDLQFQAVEHNHQHMNISYNMSK